MKNRSEEQIKLDILKMWRKAEELEGEKLDLIDSYVSEEPPKNCNVPVWYLGKSIEKLADADVVIGVKDSPAWVGCNIEKLVAIKYNIKTYVVDILRLD